MRQIPPPLTDIRSHRSKITSRLIACLLATALAACSPAEHTDAETPEPPPQAPQDTSVIPWPSDLPVYDHIVIVVEENKDWGDIIGNADAPYINLLASEGALFTKSYGLEHHSQGNYYWLFSGDNQGVGFVDEVPFGCTAPGEPEGCNENYPFEASSLGEQLIANGLSFKGYSESLPEVGSTIDRTHYGDDEDHDEGNPRILYARKHVPWISFKNVPNAAPECPPDGVTGLVDPECSSNLRLTDFPTDFNDLPTVSFVIPNLENDMHNVHKKPDGCTHIGSVCVGDTWLVENLELYYRWAQLNNSLLIFTFDEDNTVSNDVGLTDPFYPIPNNADCKAYPRDPALQAACGKQNNIATIFAGAHIKPGVYDEGDGITHVNILRTIEAMYGLPRSGAQQENALNTDNTPPGRSIPDDYIITDVFKRATTLPATPSGG